MGIINNIIFLISQARKQLDNKILEMSTLVLIKAKKKDMTEMYTVKILPLEPGITCSVWSQAEPQWPCDLE